ncbi:MAG: DEAD/DEAH box helicase family protein [Erysipelotrichaceae bacterium]
MFDEIKIKNIYRTRKDDLENDFIIPLLKESKIYYRGTGFFNVQALINISKGLIPYIKKGGHIKIITSVQLDFEEIKLLANSFELASQKIQSELEKEIEQQLQNEDELLKMDLITNLLAAEIIQIKVAYLPEGGIYHEKVGYLEDECGNRVFFIGSNNETHSGTRKNSETVSVIKSWESEECDTEEQKKYFELLWNDEDNDIKVIDFPEAVRNELFAKYKTSPTYSDVINKIEESNKKAKEIPTEKKKLYPYQEKAIEEFCENSYCHFFEMATGTGKTFTAVRAIEAMSSIMNGKCLHVSIVVPQIDLQTQWKREFDNLDIKNYCFGGNATSKDWESDLYDSVIDYFNGERIVVTISTYDTFFSKVNDALKDHVLNKLLIVDEAHELSANQIAKLSDDFKFRLGLSATPERHSKDETERIINYFTKGNVETFKYTIDEAIKNKFLSNYEYHPIIVRLENSENEFIKYQKYTKQLAQLFSEKSRDVNKIQTVLNNRSLLIKKANAKIDEIRAMSSSDKYSFKNSVVYCGPGLDKESDESIIDSVTKALAFSGKYVVSQFTSNTSFRKEVLEEFENGFYDTLVAIKCFDQGVDVPKLDKIYIMSSDTTSRQTIQRRGRVLRICKDTGKEIAYIYDMVTLPPLGMENAAGSSKLVRSELKRVIEYGRLATNKLDVDKLVNKMNDDYGIEEDVNDADETGI